MRYYIYILYFLLSASCVMLFSCTGDESDMNTSSIANNDVYNNSDDFTKDSVSLDFHLLNEYGDTTNVFSVGDDIIFDLTIYNHKNTPLTYGLPGLFGSNTFRVYTSNMLDCGLPWVYERDWDDKLRSLKAGSMLHFQCSWYGSSDSTYHFPAPKNVNFQQLKAGIYNTYAYIHFDNIPELSMSLNFVINENE